MTTPHWLILYRHPLTGELSIRAAADINCESNIALPTAGRDMRRPAVPKTPLSYDADPVPVRGLLYALPTSLLLWAAIVATIWLLV